MIVEELPCIDIPPETLILVFDGAGEEVRDFKFGRSDIREPAAEGGGFGDAFREDVEMLEDDIGSWRASGLSERARVFANGGS